MKKNGKRILGLVFAAACAMGLMSFASACEMEEAENHTHDYSARRDVITPATCVEDGLALDYCACGESHEVKLDRLGHDYQIKQDECVEATCMKEGQTVEVCSRCSDRQVHTTEKIAHDFGEWETETPATSSAPGKKVRHCKREGCDGKEEEEIPKLEVETFQLSVNVLRTSGEVFPSTRGIRIEVQDKSGYVIERNYQMSHKFQLPDGEYNVVIVDVPEGFTVDQTSIPADATHNSVEFVLHASLLKGVPKNTTTYKVGSVLYDQTLEIIGLTEEEDKKVTISELLTEYKAILFNVYFSTCDGCVSEVDYLMNAYNARSSTGKIYGEEVAMVMLASSASRESKATIRRFKADPTTGKTAYQNYGIRSRNLPTMMAYCPAMEELFLRNRESFKGYPTTVIVDSEGVIIHLNTVVARSADEFTKLMDRAITIYQKLHENGNSAGGGDQAPVALLPEQLSVEGRGKND